MRTLTIGQNDAGQRLDKFLTKALPRMPKSLLYKSVRTKKIKVNRKRAQPEQILAVGDELQLFLPDDLFDKTGDADTKAELARIKGEVPILYEDENLVLIDKRPGVAVHEDDKGSADTLLSALRAYLYRRGEYDPDKEQSFAPSLCNRIDRNTGGIVIAAKNAETLRDMNERIRRRVMGKFYLAAVHGVPKESEATLTGYLLKDEKKKEVTVFRDNPPKNAKKIATRYRTLATSPDGKLALLEVELLTGRTHQIRAHLASVGHPLLGEGKYAENRGDRAKGFRFQALTAYRLVFPAPQGDSLDYLSERVFTVPPESVAFLSLFPGIGEDVFSADNRGKDETE